MNYLQKGREIVVNLKSYWKWHLVKLLKVPNMKPDTPLRFPVVKKNIRKDKGINDIDTVERLLSMYETQ